MPVFWYFVRETVISGFYRMLKQGGVFLFYIWHGCHLKMNLSGVFENFLIKIKKKCKKSIKKWRERKNGALWDYSVFRVCEFLRVPNDEREVSWC